jgi:hypothetical protein
VPAVGSRRRHAIHCVVLNSRFRRPKPRTCLIKRKPPGPLAGRAARDVNQRYSSHPWTCPCVGSGRTDGYAGMPMSESRLSAFAMVACHEQNTE